MKATLALLASTWALLLAACGGEPVPTAVLAGAAKMAARSAPDDGLATQRLYVAYLGRPADAAGLAFYQAVERGSATPAAAGMLALHASDPAFAALAARFADSAEARQLHQGDDATYLTAVYRQLFNRDPDQAGVAFWTGALERAVVERTTAPLALLAGAHGDDLRVFERKVALAAAFTEAAGPSYDGLRAAVVARAMLERTQAGMDEQALAAAVRGALGAIAGDTPVSASEVHAVIIRRCVACHSVTPTMPGFATAPRGIRFDTIEQVNADARRIHVNVVATAFMPYGNRTHMTQAERQLIDVWFRPGAY